ncbi:hypothetical protein INR38_24855 [Delftia sp. SD018]|uniref:hypothetical protein n=1 Tax=unclassified Delftia TaxID=2613839 RepID=UPI001A962C59|nr:MULTISPECIES: hypothetical protein [unclassified Delftia]MBO0990140.1 hypothetical protein [Delftia sp. SD083]MBO1037312.1 hypothetical protein [Delftia sp. SD018]
MTTDQSQAKCAFAIGLLLLLPATWSFFSAIWSAMSTGEVLVISIHRFRMERVFVSWLEGWPRFAGPGLLMASLLLWWLQGVHSSPRNWQAPGVCALAGLSLLLFSKWFAAWSGAALFLGCAAYCVLAAFVNHRYSQGLAAALLLASAAALLWLLG